MIGRIYHVVDKTTGEVVKVGSTTRTLAQRWSTYNKKKFSNHFLSEIRNITSSVFDEYIKDDPFCPFLWHLLAIEHLEMAKANTFRKSILSNHDSPLYQKFFGFDSVVAGQIGGRATNKTTNGRKSNGGRAGAITNIANGNLAKARSCRTRESFMPGALAGGKANAESGGAAKLGKSKLGVKAQYEKYGPNCFSKRLTPDGRLRGSYKVCHNRWHIKRGLINPTCFLCNSKINAPVCFH